MQAIILKESFLCWFSNKSGIDHVINELTDKISHAQQQSKKGIKAQKVCISLLFFWQYLLWPNVFVQWNTVCLDLPLDVLRLAASTSVKELLARNQHAPELGVASAICERLSALLDEPANASDRRAMASEAKRRETFAHWPHMDYKYVTI